MTASTEHRSRPPNESDISSSHFFIFSFIGICSNKAEPIFAFQLPDTDFRLSIECHLVIEIKEPEALRECFVVGADLLNVQITFRIDERLDRAVGFRNQQHTTNVLVLLQIVHFHFA